MKIATIIITFLLLTSCGNTPEFRRDAHEYLDASDFSQIDAGELTITFFDVGQGDAILLSLNNETNILIDGGDVNMGKDIIIPYLQSHGIAKLDLVIISHYHSDHLVGITEVLKGPDQIENTEDDIGSSLILDRGIDDNLDNQLSYSSYIRISKDRRKTAEPGASYKFGNLALEVLSVNGQLSNGENLNINDPFDENAASIVLLIKFGNFKMFSGGDIGGLNSESPFKRYDLETPLTPLVGDIDLLKVSHHGSFASTNENFISNTKPEVAIISVGNNNNFEHPHEEVINRLLGSGCLVYQTERGFSKSSEIIATEGNIEVSVESTGSYYISF